MTFSDTESYDVYPVFKDLGYDVPAVDGGKYVKCRCPWHEDRTPSFSVSQYGYRCHSCGRHGDAISLLMEERKVSFVEAKRLASSLAGGQGSSVRGKPRRRTSSLLSVSTRD